MANSGSGSRSSNCFDDDSCSDYNRNSNETTENSIEGEENCLDMTYVNEDDQPISYDGFVEVHDNFDDYTSAATLKRNLSATFEKHAKNEEMKKSAKMNSSSSEQQNGQVKAKIQAFEQHTIPIKPKNNNKVRFDNDSCSSRPPTVPVPHKVPMMDQDKKNGQTEATLLSVYLRIRPPSASQEAIGQDQTACDNTVEVISPANKDSNVSTTIRTYPPLQSNTSKAVRGHQLHALSHNTDLIFSNPNANGGDGSVKGVKEFNFNQVFGIETPQEEIFNNVAIPLVDGLFPNDSIKLAGDKLVGKSALLFSYGITNAGKTYTIMGDDNKKEAKINTSLKESHGIIPRAIDRMLMKIKEMDNEDVKYQLKISYLEIYNEQLYDLLPQKRIQTSKNIHNGSGSSFPMDHNSLRIRESKNGGIYVRGLAKHKLTSLAKGLELIAEAKSRRHTSNNKINTESSRSHSICQFEVEAVPSALHQRNEADNSSLGTTESSMGYNTDDDSSVYVNSLTKKRSVTFWVVDLAGSERSKRTGAFSRSTRQKEAALINSSLMKLMRCLQTLRRNQSASNSSSVVPFRESKLTHLFMDHLTGAAASRTSMIVNINPSIADFDETQHVLSYATVAKSIRISESDYNKKRRAIQMAGRSKDASKSPPRKIAKIVQKLSPRAALLKMREQQKNSKRNLHHGDSSSSNNKEEPPKKKNTKIWGGRNKELEEEIENLRKSLDKYKKEMIRYRSEVDALKGKLVRCEAEIRKELYEETEHYHNCIHQQHNEIVSRLKQQLAAASQTPSKSAIKVQKDKADAMVDELLDKVDECEEEMARMTEAHKEEMELLSTKHSNELAKQDEEISFLKATIERNQCEIINLNEELSKKNETIKDLESEIYGTSDSASEADPEMLESISGNEAKTEEMIHEKENVTVDPSPCLRRLPRTRCSEVACANISPPNEKRIQLSSSKKQQRKGFTKNIRSPFKQRKENNQDSLKQRSAEKRGLVSKDLLFPTVEADYDEKTGLYLRPRGRAPTGRIWDAREGAWVMTSIKKNKR